jgi:hypothetical protein
MSIGSFKYVPYGYSERGIANMPDPAPEYEEVYLDKVFVPAIGGWLDESKPLSDEKESFSVYDTRSTDRRDKEEWEIYDELYAEYVENEWGFLWDWLNTELFSDMEFVGEGAKAAYKFFDETCPNAREELVMMGLNVVREGTGMLKKFSVGKELKQIKAVNGRLIRLKVVNSKEKTQGTSESIGMPDTIPIPNGNQYLEVTIHNDDKFKEYLQEWPLEKPEDYRHDEIALCRIRRDPRTPYGLGFASACLHAIKALKGVNRDVLVGVKQNANNIKVVGVDLSDLDDDSAKQNRLKKTAYAYREMNSATSGVLAIDLMNDIYYMGTGAKGSGSGGGGNRMLPVMQHIEPVLTALLMNFLFSIGLIEQTGANKSLIAKQELRAERQMKRYRAAVANFIQTQILKDITKADVKVLFEPQLEIVEWIALFEQSAITRERILQEFSIRDEGKTYAYTLQLAPAGPTTGSSPRATVGGRKTSKTGSNDDNTSKKRNTAKASTTTGRGS